jgi:hypothetical protein
MTAMKIFAALSTSALFLLLVSVAPVGAQEERHDEGSPTAPKREEAKPAHQEAAPPHGGEARPEHREGDKASKQDDKAPRQDDRAPRQDEKARKQDDKAPRQDERARKQEARPEDKEARHDAIQPGQKSERPDQPHNGGGGKGHIPDDRFRAHFGREHTFRVSRPVVVEGRPRFQYSGYWFEFGNPWPEDWSYDDDCYIDYVDDEYYLFDPRHPGMRILVIVVS